ncbi:MAG: hypothetical protein LBG58_02255 [Planctomycetaceae bacterium]|nr:hypothetical protein [Planctomycetaceae bacterium]
MFNSPLIYCPFRALMVLTITRRVAAGWLVLPFQGERTTVLINHHPQTENAHPNSGDARGTRAFLS